MASCDRLLQAILGQGLAHGGQRLRRCVVGQRNRLHRVRVQHVAKRLARGREHQLLVHLALRGCTIGGLRQHLSGVAMGGCAELVERIEEMVVA